MPVAAMSREPASIASLMLLPPSVICQAICGDIDAELLACMGLDLGLVAHDHEGQVAGAVAVRDAQLLGLGTGRSRGARGPGAGQAARNCYHALSVIPAHSSVLASAPCSCDGARHSNERRFCQQLAQCVGQDAAMAQPFRFYAGVDAAGRGLPRRLRRSGDGCAA